MRCLYLSYKTDLRSLRNKKIGYILGILNSFGMMPKIQEYVAYTCFGSEKPLLLIQWEALSFWFIETEVTFKIVSDNFIKIGHNCRVDRARLILQKITETIFTYKNIWKYGYLE